MTCDELQPLLAACADGAASDLDRASVDRHLASCSACRDSLRVQMSIRAALVAHGRASADQAPPGLRTRIVATLAAEPRTARTPGWGTRASAFAAAALVVLAIGAAALPALTRQSTMVLAAQLALDHLKCFSIDGHDHGASLPVADAERTLEEDYGWRIDVPETLGAGCRLVGVRRCLYADGRAAHLLYRMDGAPVSLFILPGIERTGETLDLLGQDAVAWNDQGRTYLLVGAAGSHSRLGVMASHLQNGAK